MSNIPFERRSFVGGAAASTLTNDITSGTLTLPLSTAAGWPDGTNGPFYAVLGRGQTDEEKVRVTGVSGTNASLSDASDRGVDNTVAQAHSAGTTIEVCLSAIDLDEANSTANQMLGQITAKGDMIVGTAANTTGTMSVGADGTFLLANSADSLGMSYGPIPTGAISSSPMFAAGVVNAAALGSSAVTTAKINNAAVDENKLATSVAGAGLVGGAGTALRVAYDDTTIKATGFNTLYVAKVNDGGINTLAQFATPIGPIVSAASAPASPWAGLGWWDTATARLKVYTGTHWQFVGGQPPVVALNLQTATTFIVASRWNTLPYNETKDTDAAHASTNGYITLWDIDITQDAFYVRVDLDVQLNRDGTGDDRGLGFDVGASAFTTGLTPPSYDLDVRPMTANSAPRISVSKRVPVTKGQVLTPAVWARTSTTAQATGSTLTVTFDGYQ